MNNENKTRIRTVWLMVSVMIITLFFGVEPAVSVQMKENMVYNKYILYINKYNNLVNIKDIIYIDIYKYNKRINNKNLNVKIKNSYLINDLYSRTKFIMPEYSVKLNLKTTRVDKRVIISRLANALKSQETGGATAYSRKSYSSSACGAYQYMPSTWNNYMGYKNACQAPAWVQDSRIIHELEFNYNRYHDWSKAVAAHLMPSRANNKSTWNKYVPGNPTIAQYVNSVLNKANLVYA
jgi:hypothetical protein